MGRAGIERILSDCASGKVKALVLQGAELLTLLPEPAAALERVPFVAVMATHEHPALERANLVLPTTVWAEMDGTFTNYQRRVQIVRRALPAPGAALPRWELAAGVLRRLGADFTPGSAREVFAMVARAVPDYAGLDYRLIGGGGRMLAPGEAVAAQEARA
jgi:predicted molibdopterin-dependent oxidoreductase YjgC